MAGESGLNYNAIAFLLVLGLFAGMLLLDYPRFGFIRLDFADQALINLLAGMK
jgi:hypothetical protein